MSTGVRSWLYLMSQMRPPLPPSLCLPLTTISLCLSPMTPHTPPYPSPLPPQWPPPTAPALHQPPPLRTTSTQCCWCSWSSAWCSVMCWCVWQCLGSVLCRPPPTTSLSHWLCPTCCWLRWSCPGASTWRCVCAFLLYSFIAFLWDQRLTFFCFVSRKKWKNKSSTDAV